MITNWGEKIARRLAASGTILSEDIDLYGYGFFLLLSSALYLFVVAIFGSVLGIFWESILFYFMFSILREYAGGIHAKTERGCMLSTILALLLSTVGIRGMLQAEHSTIAMMFLIVGCAVVFFSVPWMSKKSHYRLMTDCITNEFPDGWHQRMHFLEYGPQLLVGTSFIP